MRKLFYAGVLFLLGLDGYAQTGACCILPATSPSNPSGIIFCYQAEQQSCLAAPGASEWLGANSACYGSDGYLNCLSTVCCKANGECVRRVSRAQCETSGAGARFFERANCRACLTGKAPVVLASMKAVYADELQAVRLTWEQEASMDNKQFYVERSRDGENYKVIGYADQNTWINGRYEFTDINPYEIGYYRLSFLSAQFSAYSQPMVVIAAGNGTLQVMPNPASGTVKVLLQNMQLHETEVSVFDLSGRTVLSKNLGKGQYEINVAGLAQGNYIITARQNGRLYTGRLIRN